METTGFQMGLRVRVRAGTRADIDGRAGTINGKVFPDETPHNQLWIVGLHEMLPDGTSAVALPSASIDPGEFISAEPFEASRKAVEAADQIVSIRHADPDEMETVPRLFVAARKPPTARNVVELKQDPKTGLVHGLVEFSKDAPELEALFTSKILPITGPTEGRTFREPTTPEHVRSEPDRAEAMGKLFGELYGAQKSLPTAYGPGDVVRLQDGRKALLVAYERRASFGEEINAWSVRTAEGFTHGYETEFTPESFADLPQRCRVSFGGAPERSGSIEGRAPGRPDHWIVRLDEPIDGTTRVSVAREDLRRTHGSILISLLQGRHSDAGAPHPVDAEFRITREEAPPAHYISLRRREHPEGASPGVEITEMNLAFEPFSMESLNSGAPIEPPPRGESGEDSK